MSLPGKNENNIIDNFTVVSGYVAGVLLLFAAVITTWDVLARSLLKNQSAWALEISQYALLIATFLGAAYTLKERGYIEVDFLVNRLSPRKRKIIAIFSEIVIVLVFAYLTYLIGILLVKSYLRGWKTSTPLRVPLFSLVFFMVLGCVSVTIQQLNMLCRNFFNRKK